MAKGKVEKRGARKRVVKPVILIVTEGTQTEPKYFNQFRTRKTNIDIQVIKNKTGGARTDYMSLVAKAKEHRDSKDLSKSNGDSVWVVADGDINYGNDSPIESKNAKLNEARTKAEKENIHLIISNPCFEYWYLLHYKYTTAFFKDYDAVEKVLKAYIPTYDKDLDVSGILEDKMDNAIQHAQRVEQFHCADGKRIPFTLEVNPFTDVYKLVQTIK